MRKKQEPTVKDDVLKSLKLTKSAIDTYSNLIQGTAQRSRKYKLINKKLKEIEKAIVEEE